MNGNGSYQPQNAWGNEYADLDGYGQNAAPQHAFRPNLETVANGDYDCEFVEASIDRAGTQRVVRTLIRLLNAGRREVEHIYWLNRQEAVNDFLAEMAALDFPANQWGSGPGKSVPLSVAIPDCVRKLPGLKFRASKSSRHVPARPAGPGTAAMEAKTFHSLNISGKIFGAPMPPVGVTQAAQAAMATSQQPPLQEAGVDDGIPF